MKRALLSLAVTLLFFGYSSASAAAVTLDSIGVSSVGGRRISSWTYQGKNPVFKGTTDPSGSVILTIDGSDNTVTADAAGAWTFAPTSLATTGTYPITIVSGTDTLTFTLDLTVSSTSTTAATSTTSGELVLPDELPQTGSFQQTAVLIGSGLGLMLTGILFYWKVVPKLLFDESIIEIQPTKRA